MSPSDRPPDPPTCRATHESGDQCSLPIMHRKHGMSTPHWCEETGREWRGDMRRPPLDDEHNRVQFWIKSLGVDGDRQDVIRSAAHALALRDAEIARLRRVIEDTNPPKDRKS